MKFKHMMAGWFDKTSKRKTHALRLDGTVWRSGRFIGLSIATIVISHYCVLGRTLYVDMTCLTPIAPYVGWSTAATNIQDAIDVSEGGDLILVTNGIYRFGGNTTGGNQGNRIALMKDVAVLSVNGPAATFIEGAMAPSIRCAYVGTNSILSGFTLTNGVTVPGASGGGAWCETSGTISNCLLTGNSADLSGGGAIGGNYFRCVFTNNVATWGGGAWSATLSNCVLAGNRSGEVGGGAGQSKLYNCTVTANTSGETGGGVWDCAVYNSIVYHNTGCSECGNADNYYPFSFGSFDYSCTWPLPPRGTSNIDQEPLFVDLEAANFRLQVNSPCINVGNNGYVSSSTDLDGRLRIVSGTVDLGAYEFDQAVSGEFLAWLNRYSLPADGTADTVDSDGDGQNNWNEWRSVTDPRDPTSSLRLLPPLKSGTNIVLRWPSVTNSTYVLEQSSTIGDQQDFHRFVTGLVGGIGVTAYTVTNAGSIGTRFYRVGVE